MHNHNPSKFSNPILRFLHFLFMPWKIYQIKEGTAICHHCRVALRTPEAYYNDWLPVIYAMMGFIIGLLAFIPAFLGTLAAFGTAIIIHHIVTSVVLAFCSWEAYDDSKFDYQTYLYRKKRKRKNVAIKVSACLIGMFFGNR